MERLEAELQKALLPKDPNDERNTLPRDPRRHRRRRVGAVRRRPVPHVHALRRAQGLAGRDHLREPVRARRLQGSDRAHRRPGRVFAPQVRVRRPPRAARAGDRGAGPHPHLGLHGRGAAGGRRDRRRGAQSGGAARRHLPRLRRRRPARQQDRLRDPRHAPAHRHRGGVPGRALAAQEPREGAVACWRRASGQAGARAAGEDRRDAQDR